jgi:hypothetical protein
MIIDLPKVCRKHDINMSMTSEGNDMITWICSECYKEWKPIDSFPTDGRWYQVSNGKTVDMAYWRNARICGMRLISNPRHWKHLPPATAEERD